MEEVFGDFLVAAWRQTGFLSSMGPAKPGQALRLKPLGHARRGSCFAIFYLEHHVELQGKAALPLQKGVWKKANFLDAYSTKS